MCKFLNIHNDRILHLYYSQIENCSFKYHKYLYDDFTNFSNLENLISKLKPYFWIIVNQQNQFMGFVYLDNFIGNKNRLYSAEITTCFEKVAWGDYTKYCGKIFLKKCFDIFNFVKIKALIYPQNFKVKKLLKSCGFTYETLLKNETFVNNKMQDIEIYSLYRNYYNID